MRGWKTCATRQRGCGRCTKKRGSARTVLIGLEMCWCVTTTWRPRCRAKSSPCGRRERNTTRPRHCRRRKTWDSTCGHSRAVSLKLLATDEPLTTIFCRRQRTGRSSTTKCIACYWKHAAASKRIARLICSWLTDVLSSYKLESHSQRVHTGNRRGARFGAEDTRPFDFQSHTGGNPTRGGDHF